MGAGFMYYFDRREDERFYYIKDHLGSIRITIDEDGEVVSAQDYYPYGEILRSYITGGNVNDKYKFTEKERDTETGYDYFGARYYDSEIGRWLSVDPMASSRPGLSPYNYCQNNPLVRIDPDGMRDIANSANGDDEEDEKKQKAQVIPLPFPEVPLPLGPSSSVESMASTGKQIKRLFDKVEEIDNLVTGVMFLGITSVHQLFAENKKGKENDKSNSENKTKPNFKDPSKSPGKDWEWRGKGKKGSRKGSWYNPKTGETYHPDLNHSEPIGPHYDYKDPKGNWWRQYPNGTKKPKK